MLVQIEKALQCRRTSQVLVRKAPGPQIAKRDIETGLSLARDVGKECCDVQRVQCRIETWRTGIDVRMPSLRAVRAKYDVV